MSRVSLAVLTGLVLLSACAAPSPPISACAVPADSAPHIADRGIGGTGSPALQIAERGIGGTGISSTGISSTGISGTITGFASICVNGLEIAYAPTDTVEIDGQPHPTQDLRIGQIVTAQTAADQPTLTASRLSVRHAVSGPVEAILTPGRRFLIAGQQVVLPQETQTVAVGDWLAVSGLRDAHQTINATRLDRRPPGEVLITGRLRITADGARIAATPLNGLVPAALHGQTVTASGHYSNGVLRVVALRPALPPLQAGTAGTVVLEAYIQTEGDHLVLGDGQTVPILPSLGTLPANPSHAVMVLTQSADGSLTAIAMHDGKDAPNLTPSSGPAPHAPASAPTSSVHTPESSGKLSQTASDSATSASAPKGDPSSSSAGTSPSAAKK